MSISMLSGLSRKENSELRPSNKSLRLKANRILRPADTSNLTVFDDRQIAQQLNQELNLLDNLIKGYKRKISLRKSIGKSISNVEQDVINLEETILLKNQEISSLNEEIQKLKIVKAREPFQVNKKGSQMFSLAKELKKERVELQELMNIHNQKVTNKNSLVQAVKRLEKVFATHYPSRQIGYQMFKEKKLQILREEAIINKKQLKFPSSIGDKIENTSSPSVTSRSESDSRNENKSMKQLQDKKRITKLAIRNAKKKHLNQISELTAKLEFLRDENSLLDQKIKETEVQKMNLQLRFNLNVQNKIVRKQRRFISQNQFF